MLSRVSSHSVVLWPAAPSERPSSQRSPSWVACSSSAFSSPPPLSWADSPLQSDRSRSLIGPGPTLVFRRVSPAAEQLDYPDFSVLETEVTNAQFKAYLDATNRTKDDSEVLRIIEERHKKVA